MPHLSMGSTVIALGWVKRLTRVTSFFPFTSILLILPFSLLVQIIFFRIQSTARPEICLSEQSFCNGKTCDKQLLTQSETSARSNPLKKVPYLKGAFEQRSASSPPVFVLLSLLLLLCKWPRSVCRPSKWWRLWSESRGRWIFPHQPPASSGSCHRDPCDEWLYRGQRGKRAVWLLQNRKWRVSGYFSNLQHSKCCQITL